jgi:4-hydroxythreonine-4-phosphate dehydrogenase
LDKSIIGKISDLRSRTTVFSNDVRHSLMHASNRILLLTQGDPAGIGPELALKAWLGRKSSGLAPFAFVGSMAQLRRVSKLTRIDVPLASANLANASDVFEDALPVIATEGVKDFEIAPGSPDTATATGTMGAIEQAVKAVMAGHARAIITNPIAKHVLYAAGFKHPGHTEYLAALATTPGKEQPLPVMMLWCDELAVVPVTIHIPLKDVPLRLTTQLIVETGRIVAHDLHTRFGIAAPRLALAGLNPHAGENGTMGTEDQTIIAPAIAALKAEGIDASGPWPADTMFHARARSQYDAGLCMYHDQALIPIKTIAFDDGVNVTLGLPFVRTSPDHGTAFDIAGKGLARPDSLIAALKLADRLTGGNTLSVTR